MHNTVNARPIVGVVGTGVMGRGIIQLLAQSGHEVRYFDATAAAVVAATSAVTEMLVKLRTKNTLNTAQYEAACSCLQPIETLAQLQGCDVIIEAIVEDLSVKRVLFKQLEGVVDTHTILASNTSSFLIAEIAAACECPQRVAGLHFFNPVPLMKLVEIIAGVRTGAQTTARLRFLIESTGHRAVVAADQPGFLVNHAGRGLYTEGLRIVEEGVASFEDVDRVLREGLGFRMGPFELLDLTGLDVSGTVMKSIYEQFYQEPRYRPSSLVHPRVAAGLHGRKTGAGFYEYSQGRTLEPNEAGVAASENFSVWLEPQREGTVALQTALTAAGVSLAGEPGAPNTLILLQLWGEDLSEACTARGFDPGVCVALDPLVPLERRRTLMFSPATRPEIRAAALAIAAVGGVPVTAINDSAGFIAQRVLATIVNIGCEIAQRGIGSVTDLEDAVRLGLNYPEGPLSWGDAIGAKKVLNILAAQYKLSGDPRYRASPWLRRRAALGLSLKAPEALDQRVSGAPTAAAR